MAITLNITCAVTQYGLMLAYQRLEYPAASMLTVEELRLVLKDPVYIDLAATAGCLSFP
jgi:hypothetical protein